MKVVCFGDSNTWGYNPMDGSRYDEKTRWPRLLEQYGKFEVVEEGLNGRTISFEDPLNPNRCGQKILQMVLETHKPFDVLIIMLGTNDMIEMHHCDSMSIATGIRNLIRIAKNPYLWEDYPIPEILVVAPLLFHSCMENVPDMITYYGTESFQKAHELPDYMKAFCDQYGCHFMNAADFACASEIDGVHLDEEGHAALARGIAAKLLEIGA